MQEAFTMTFKRIYESNNHGGLAGPVKFTDKIDDLNARELDLKTMSQQMQRLSNVRIATLSIET